MGRLYSLAWLAEFMHDPPKTQAEWLERAAAGPWPSYVDRLAALELDGDIALIHPAWAGWRLNPRSGRLEAPNGFAFRPDEVVAISIRMGQLRELHQMLERIGAALRSGLTLQVFQELIAVTRPYLENDHHRIERGIAGQSRELLSKDFPAGLPSLLRYDYAEPSELQLNRCKGTTAKGRPCRLWSQGVTDFCQWHQVETVTALPSPSAGALTSPADTAPESTGEIAQVAAGCDGIGAGDEDPIAIAGDERSLIPLPS